MGLHGREAFPRKISMQGHKNPMTFLFLHHEISKGKALSLISHCIKEKRSFPRPQSSEGKASLLFSAMRYKAQGFPSKRVYLIARK
jgi:hypothetical protein